MDSWRHWQTSPTSKVCKRQNICEPQGHLTTEISKSKKIRIVQRNIIGNNNNVLLKLLLKLAFAPNKIEFTLHGEKMAVFPSLSSKRLSAHQIVRSTVQNVAV